MTLRNQCRCTLSKNCHEEGAQGFMALNTNTTRSAMGTKRPVICWCLFSMESVPGVSTMWKSLRKSHGTCTSSTEGSMVVERSSLPCL